MTPGGPIPPHAYSLALDDKTPVLLRPLGPGDRQRIIDAYRLLSPESALFRFWGRFRELNASMVDRLTSTDQENHIAWAAIHPDRDDLPGLGAASFWRIEDDPASAEVSFTVADDFQGRGLGTLLLAALWADARQVGITRFIAYVLDANFTMRAWWESLGAQSVHGPHNWTFTLQLDEIHLPKTHAAQRLLHWIDILDAQRSRDG